MSVKRYYIPGFSINESEKFVLADDYDKVVELCRKLVNECDHLHDFVSRHGGCTVDNCRTAKIKAESLALVGDGGGEEQK